MFKLKKISLLLLASCTLCSCTGNLQSSLEEIQNLQTQVTETLAQAEASFENLVEGAQETYATLLIKKQELTQTITEIQEAAAALDQLLGKNETDTATQKEIAELQAELEAALAAAEAAQAVLTEQTESATESTEDFSEIEEI